MVKLLEDPEVLVANVDRHLLHVSIVLKPKELVKLLSNFQNKQARSTASAILLTLPLNVS